MQSVVVVGAIDGDTIVLSSGEYVRLIGVDTPELDQPGSLVATQFVKNRVEGRTVWLEPDGADQDRYDRLRRYVWLRKPTDSQDENQIRQYMLNALLLSNRHAKVSIVGDVKNGALFRRLEQEAWQ